MPRRPLALVEYSDSDSDAGGPPAKIPKIPKQSSYASPTALPPLPSRFHELYATAPRVAQADDPSLHGGRKRAIPHVQGNWPTHVFVEWYLSHAEFDRLNDVYTITSKLTAKDGVKLESHLKSELGSELPLHLSLSRPNVLTTGQREGFMEVLEDKIEKTRIKPFTVRFTGFQWVSNFDKTRWFFVLNASKGPANELPRLLQLSNSVFASFSQPPLYSQKGDGMDGFHVSLAWSLQRPSEETMQAVEKALADGGGVVAREEQDGLTMEVEAVKAKVGNAVHIVKLGKRDGDTRTWIEAGGAE